MLKKLLIAGSLVLIAAVVAFVYLVGFYRPRYESQRPLSLAEAKPHLKIELPSEAQQIWILDAYQGPGHFQYAVRFHAPLAMCIAWAAQMQRGELGWESNEVAAVVRRQESRLPAWYDVHTIQDGLRLVGPGTHYWREIWIDRGRQTAFYYAAD